MTWPILLAIAAVFVLAGLVKGVTGLGLPTVSLALLSLFLPLPEAMRLILVPSLLTNLLQAGRGGHLLPLLRRLWPMLAALCAGVALVAIALPGEATSAAQAILGAVLCLYALLDLLRPPRQMAPRTAMLLGPLAGVATGVLTALTGSFVLPSVPYMQALGLSRVMLVQAMGITFSVATLALAAALGRLPAGGGMALLVSLLAVAPAALGMAAGAWLARRMSAQVFRRWFFVCLGGLGLHLLIAGLG
jgi:uncharacterized membrane protein YfcA